jgi:NAD(P)-dependent dehydrogenase (short-subunit alcohol dehydrogenase family)
LAVEISVRALRKAEEEMSKKVALVTGSNKGIGKEIVRTLASHGYTVYLGARNEQRGHAAAQELVSAGGDVRFVKIDLTDSETIRAAAEKVREEVGKLDVLINNAGVALEAEPPSTANTALLKATFQTNYFGMVEVTQAFLPLLRASTTRVILNVTSGLGSITKHTDPAWEFGGLLLLGYNSSKAAVNMFTVLLAKELRAEGFKVNAVSPGYTATDLNQFRGHETVEEAAAYLVQYALLDEQGPTAGFFAKGEGTLPW